MSELQRYIFPVIRYTCSASQWVCLRSQNIAFHAPYPVASLLLLSTRNFSLQQTSQDLSILLSVVNTRAIRVLEQSRRQTCEIHGLQIRELDV